jgi:hypothetical protein
MDFSPWRLDAYQLHGLKSVVRFVAETINIAADISGADVFLVDATVFKTVVGLHRPGWVRFPDAPAIYP